MLRRSMVGVTLGALFVGTGALARAQSDPHREIVHQTLQAPANLTLGTLPATSYQGDSTTVELVLEGTTDDKTGVASIGWKRGSRELRVKVKGPLDKSGRAEPLSLEGLGADAELDVAFNWMAFGHPTPEEQGQVFDVCNAILPEACRATNAAKGCDKLTTPVTVDQLATLCTDPDTAPDVCRVCNLEEMPSRYRPVVQRLLRHDTPSWIFGGNVTGGRKTFEYLEGTDLTAQSVIRDSWSATARLGFYSSDFGFVLASYTYERGYRAAGGEADICQPIAGTPAVRCSAGVIGAPVEQERRFLSLEARRFFLGGTAIAPRIQRDLEKKTTAVAVPIYFLTNKEGAPTGGVRLAWRSDTRAATVSVFVGAALKVF